MVKRTQAKKETEPTTVLHARVKVSVAEVIEAAARIRGLDLQDVIERGSLREANRIIEVALKEIRRHKERQRRARLELRRAQREKA